MTILCNGFENFTSILNWNPKFYGISVDMFMVPGACPDRPDPGLHGSGFGHAFLPSLSESEPDIWWIEFGIYLEIQIRTKSGPTKYLCILFYVSHLII